MDILTSSVPHMADETQYLPHHKPFLGQPHSPQCLQPVRATRLGSLCTGSCGRPAGVRVKVGAEKTPGQSLVSHLVTASFCTGRSYRAGLGLTTGAEEAGLPRVMMRTPDSIGGFWKTKGPVPLLAPSSKSINGEQIPPSAEHSNSLCPTFPWHATLTDTGRHVPISAWWRTRSAP